MHLPVLPTPSAQQARLIEAGLRATHAYQVLLARRSGAKVDGQCFGWPELRDEDLRDLAQSYESVLRLSKRRKKRFQLWLKDASAFPEVEASVRSILDRLPALDERAPARVARISASVAGQNASVAHLLQVALEVDRDGDFLQDLIRLYLDSGLPVYYGQLGAQAPSDSDLLENSRTLSEKSCASPYETSPQAWQIAQRKIWNWGEKRSGARDARVLADEWIAALKPMGPERPGASAKSVTDFEKRIRALPPRKIAVIGHSFTNDAHWASPSAFVPIAREVLSRWNPGIRITHWMQGGLSIAGAEKLYVKEVEAHRPDEWVLVLASFDLKSVDALKRLAARLGSGQRIRIFNAPEIHDPYERNEKYAREAVAVCRALPSCSVIESRSWVEAACDEDYSKCLSLDRVHMNEKYHRAMAAVWLRHLSD